MGCAPVGAEYFCSDLRWIVASTGSYVRECGAVSDWRIQGFEPLVVAVLQNTQSKSAQPIHSLDAMVMVMMIKMKMIMKENKKNHNLAMATTTTMMRVVMMMMMMMMMMMVIIMMLWMDVVADCDIQKRKQLRRQVVVRRSHLWETLEQIEGFVQ
jgi:hypothetical protein